jgi:hypothetical protein
VEGDLIPGVASWAAESTILRLTEVIDINNLDVVIFGTEPKMGFDPAPQEEIAELAEN